MTRLPRRLIFIFMATVLALIAAAGSGASFAWKRYTASLGPLDLAASREGSTIVIDREAGCSALHFARRALAAAGDHA